MTAPPAAILATTPTARGKRQTPVLPDRDDLPTARPRGRVVVPHVDDLGASHGANRAFLDLPAAGSVTCGSVMVPGPWFREIVEAAAADPALDVGVHLTLTSEWDAWRWAPISTTSRTSGLIDDDGYLWRDVASLRRNLVPEAAEAEMRAQVERAVAAGLAPTHVGAHMAAAMLPGLLDAHVTVASDHGLMPFLPRSITWPPDPVRYRAAIAALDAEGASVVDHCRGTLAVDAGDLEDGRTLATAGPSAAEEADRPGGLTCNRSPEAIDGVQPTLLPRWRVGLGGRG